MGRMNGKRFFAAIALTVLASLTGLAQVISPAPRDRSIIKTEAVQYLFPEQVAVPAGWATTVELHFRVAQGLHINSHAPSDAFLIPTDFSIPSDVGVRLHS